jgi:gas vesicle protein
MLKEMHVVIQRYKNKNLEKVLSEKQERFMEEILNWKEKLN